MRKGLVRFWEFGEEAEGEENESTRDERRRVGEDGGVDDGFCGNGGNAELMCRSVD